MTSRQSENEECAACAGKNKTCIDWVLCEKCVRWFHYQCVGVDDSVKDKDWTCEICTMSAAAPPTQVSRAKTCRTPDHTTSTNVLKTISVTTTATTTPLAAAANYMSTYEAPPYVADQVKFNNNFPNLQGFWEKTDTNLSSGSTQKRTADLTTNVVRQKTSSSMLDTGVNVNVADTAFTTSHGESNMHCRKEEVHDNGRQKELLLAQLEEENAAQQRYIKAKYKILNEPGANVMNSCVSLRLTETQIAARKVIPRDLPNFSGDPEDWPAFISSYETGNEVAGYSNMENMLRLQKCLKGKAKELVRDKLIIPAMVPEVINTLRLFFGRPEHIIERVINKVRKLPPPRDKLEAIIEYSLAVRNVWATMEACQLKDHLNNPMLVSELVDKLPNSYKLQWGLTDPPPGVPIIQALSDWLYRIAIAASRVVPAHTSKPSSVHVHTQRQEEKYQKRCGVCGTEGHHASECHEFRDMSCEERWRAVKEKQLCRQCLKKHRDHCYTKKVCGKEGCDKRHHMLLHQNETFKTEIVTSHVTQGETQLFRIIPVKLFSRNMSLSTFAFLDEGSSVTLMNKAVFDGLQLKGTRDPICLQWTGDTTRAEDDSIRCSVEIADVNGGQKYWLNNVHTVDDLALPTQNLDVMSLKRQCKYLENIPINSYVGAKPTLLIGVDNWKLAVPTRTREGRWNEPIATKCRLGWSLQGGTPLNSTRRVLVHVCQCEVLQDMVKNSFNLDITESRTIVSKEDQQAIEVLEKTSIKKDGQYEVGLLWKAAVGELPESYAMAYRRMLCLENKIKKEPALKAVVQQKIDHLISEGYAFKINQVETTSKGGREWYLPIFLVKNPNKPAKLRLVWDAAARSRGKSLNDFLSSGPDLLNQLVDVLLAFRTGRVAICGDIAEMFHRININEYDMHAQRFLWRENEDEKNPSVYVMRAMTFGIRCAPCIAHFIRNKNAEKFEKLHPRAVQAIRQQHYVDDFIDCLDTVEEVVNLAKNVRSIHAEGGFHIRGWASNAAEVVEQLQEPKKETQQPIPLGEAEKVLGMFWDPQGDTFKFICKFARLRRDVIKTDVIPTKREVLQVLMSIFDPLGLISCYTIELKILLQYVWRKNMGWDEELPHELQGMWKKWKETFKAISDVEIPRCFSTVLNSATNIQLHTFVDASQEAYAAVSYLRVVKANIINVSLVAAKAKVAPLKPMSIPRLELQAAVMGVRLAKRIVSILATRNLTIINKYYWSDSQTVLSWLEKDPRKFQQFFMHRVGEILENSDATQWNWVESKNNIADIATKIHPKNSDRYWVEGPRFLLEGEKSWPRKKETDTCDSAGNAELRKCMVHTINTENLESDVKLNAEYFSSWRKFYRAVATFILFVTRLNIRRSNRCAKIQQTLPGKITWDMIQKAKVIIWRSAQKDEYITEINSLSRYNTVGNKSKIASYNPYLDKEGVIRAQGRQAQANSLSDPIILPKGAYTTTLIVHDYHITNHHMCHETTIGLIRKSYIIPKLRVVLKTVRKNCQICKNRHSKPDIPQMAPLPPARLAVNQKPFTHVGVDFFGPITVNIGRRTEKRWGVLFTCLTVRAIHIEVAHSLDTSSCIMCFRNFMARRGVPSEVYTDNGTNFQATEKALKEGLKQVRYDQIEKKLDYVKWHFNPPSAPHMGGAWERLIRSVKNVLYAISPNMKFDDEGLRSALCEVEFIINARPLTFVSLENADEDPLTPNHLLIGSADGKRALESTEMDVRTRWRHTQKFADSFWKRWLREYAPTLTKRGKWFTKRPPLRVGDIVVIVDENSPRNRWPKGRVIETVTAKDGQVRQAIVKTQTGILRRPVAKLAVLEVGA